MRTALALLCLWASGAAADITTADYVEPTTRYPHAVLGDDVEHVRLRVGLDDGTQLEARLTDDLVFEDTAPRLFDVNGDGAAEVITVESHQSFGARLAVWGVVDGTLTRVAATDHIGTRFRWLAVVGAGDLDGDGAVEIAYVDRPHLAKTLRIVSIDGDQLVEEIAAGGVTNHRIGERDIAGGVRDCGDGPEMIVASADWSQLVSVIYVGSELRAKALGSDTSRPAFAAAMACE